SQGGGEGVELSSEPRFTDAHAFFWGEEREPVDDGVGGGAHVEEPAHNAVSGLLKVDPGDSAAVVEDFDSDGEGDHGFALVGFAIEPVDTPGGEQGCASFAGAAAGGLGRREGAGHEPLDNRLEGA